MSQKEYTTGFEPVALGSEDRNLSKFFQRLNPC
ncbi:hypothetical protein CA85_42710 [Allorhodopirellula solitaria]|uniref:Uncharacterized protein n=1 Tax=Allorhodopirellula solitaria TaxID=2527987 RepID=A0A5C5X0S3_9BACT|nr:hypothetical protein CA85_42710 [Allorhodopirellula solitaria]